MVECEAVRDFNLEARHFFIRYRLTAIILGLTIVNVLLHYIKVSVVTRFSAYKHYSAETNQMMGVRCLQLFFGIIVGVGGYGTLLYNSISGCNSSELYLFYFGGVLLLFLDLHEYVRSWPLRSPILGHHIMVFFFGLAMVEYDLIPPPNDPNPEISWPTTLLIANIGLMWITDFFHVVFRVSTSLPLIEKYRKIYLISSILRPFTFGLMIYGAVESIVKGSVAGALPSIFLSVAYGYNLYKAIQFVYMFDCEKYFRSHQAKWVGEYFDVEIDAEAIRKKRISVKYDPTTLLDQVSSSVLDEEDIFADNRASMTTTGSQRTRRSSLIKHGVLQIVDDEGPGTGKRRRSSILDNLFAIDVESDPAHVMEGLRGDAIVQNDYIQDTSSGLTDGGIWTNFFSMGRKKKVEIEY